MFHNSLAQRPLPFPMLRRKMEVIRPIPSEVRWVPRGSRAGRGVGATHMKTPFGAVFRIQSPKPIIYVPFGHKDACVLLCLHKGMNDGSEGIAPLGAVFIVVALTDGTILPCFSPWGLFL